jgi:hypothetical protein
MFGLPLLMADLAALSLIVSMSVTALQCPILSLLSIACRRGNYDRALDDTRKHGGYR